MIIKNSTRSPKKPLNHIVIYRHINMTLIDRCIITLPTDIDTSMHIVTV